jgi:transposase
VKKIPKQEYTAEFKEQAVKRSRDVGIAVAARELGLIEQTLRNWAKAFAAGKLNAPGAKPISPELMELSRLRAENAFSVHCHDAFGTSVVRDDGVHLMTANLKTRITGRPTRNHTCRRRLRRQRCGPVASGVKHAGCVCAMLQPCPPRSRNFSRCFRRMAGAWCVKKGVIASTITPRSQER